MSAPAAITQRLRALAAALPDLGSFEVVAGDNYCVAAEHFEPYATTRPLLRNVSGLCEVSNAPADSGEALAHYFAALDPETVTALAEVAEAADALVDAWATMADDWHRVGPAADRLKRAVAALRARAARAGAAVDAYRQPRPEETR